MAGYALFELAKRVGGRIVGDAHCVIKGVADPSSASPGDLVFWLERGRLDVFEASNATAVVVKEPAALSKAQLVVADPRLAMARLMPLFAPLPPYSGIHPSAVVDPSAFIDPAASLGPCVTVGAHSVVGAGTMVHPGVAIGRHVTVGQNCQLHARVVLYDGVTLGDRVSLHAGCVIGSDGYGYTKDEHGRHLKIPQLGHVMLGDDVELGANVAVDRGTFGATVIGRGTKIDNLVHIGHNDRIGEDVLIVSQVGLSGSVTVGNRAVLAGQAGVAGHLSIGEGAMVLARSGVIKNVPPGAVVSGFPARPHHEDLKRLAVLSGLERLQREFSTLKGRLDALDIR